MTILQIRLVSFFFAVVATAFVVRVTTVNSITTPDFWIGGFLGLAIVGVAVVCFINAHRFLNSKS